MIKPIAEASLNPRARITGIIYLFYFLTAVSAEVLHGRSLVAYSNSVNLIAYTCYVALTLLFYYLFKPVNKRLSLIAVFFSLAGCIIGVLSIFGPAPFNINPLVFFGPYCILIGYLIFRSTFLPRILGVLMAFAGLGWLAYLSPLVKYISLYVEILGVLAEASLMVWLIVMGVNVQRWKEQAGAIKIKSEE